MYYIILLFIFVHLTQHQWKARPVSQPMGHPPRQWWSGGFSAVRTRPHRRDRKIVGKSFDNKMRVFESSLIHEWLNHSDTMWKTPKSFALKSTEWKMFFFSSSSWNRIGVIPPALIGSYTKPCSDDDKAHLSVCVAAQRVCVCRFEGQLSSHLWCVLANSNGKLWRALWRKVMSHILGTIFHRWFDANFRCCCCCFAFFVFMTFLNPYQKIKIVFAHTHTKQRFTPPPHIPSFSHWMSPSECHYRWLNFRSCNI